MKLNQLLSVLLPAMAFCLCFTSVSAQTDSAGTYCNVYYIQSDAPEVLPFDDDCFVVDEYAIKDPRKMRTLGPIDGSADLFDRYDWAMHFYLPEVSRGERLRAVTPRDFLSRDLEVKEGEFFLTLSDNRKATRFDPVTDNVDFIAVGGHARVISFTPQEGDMPFPEYELQIDARVQKVDRSGDYPRLSGDPVRLKMVLVVEVLE